MKILTLAILLIGSAVLGAQESYVLALNAVTRTADGNPLKGVLIELYKGTKLMNAVESEDDGMAAPLEMESGPVYRVIFKKDGYQQKVAEVDATLETVFFWDNEKVLFDIQVTLDQLKEGVDLSFLDTMPMIKFSFDWSGDHHWDQDYTDRMVKRITQIRNGSNPEIVMKHFSLVDEAELAFQDKNFELALKKYDDAINVMPNQNYSARIAEIKDEQMRADWGADEYIHEADRLFETGENYILAYDYYFRASDLGTGDDSYVWDQMYKVELLLYGEYEMDWEMTRYYRDLLKKGYIAILDENYDEAIRWYEKALALYPDDPFPAQKIDEIKAMKSAAAK